MTDKQQSKILEQFINDSPLAKEIKVDVNYNHKSFKPRYEGAKAYYEDCNMLSNILLGAENFCYWLRRKGYKIAIKRQNKGYKIAIKRQKRGIMTQKPLQSTLKGVKSVTKNIQQL